MRSCSPISSASARTATARRSSAGAARTAAGAIGGGGTCAAMASLPCGAGAPAIRARRSGADVDGSAEWLSDIPRAAACRSPPPENCVAEAASGTRGEDLAVSSSASSIRQERSPSPRTVDVEAQQQTVRSPEDVSLVIADSPRDESPPQLGVGPPLEELRALQLREARSVAELAGLLRLVAAGEAAARRGERAPDGPAERALQLPVVQAAAGADEQQRLAAARSRLQWLCDSALSAFAKIGVHSEANLADVCGLLASGDEQLCRKMMNQLLRRAKGAALADTDVLAAVVGTLGCLPRAAFTSADWQLFVDFCSEQLQAVKGAGLRDHDDLARLELVAAVLAALEAADAGAPPAEAEARRVKHDEVVKPLSALLADIAKRAEAAGSWRAEAAAHLALEALVRANSDYDRFGEVVRRAKAAGRVLEKLYRAGKLVAEGVASFGVTTVIDVVLWLKENRGEAREALREMWDDMRTIAGADRPKGAEAWFARARLLGVLAERGRMAELRALLDRAAMNEVARRRKLALALCSALVAVVEREESGGRGAAAAVAAVKLLEACAEAAAGLLKDGAASLRVAAAALAHAAALDSPGVAPAAALQALQRLGKRDSAREAVTAAAARFGLDLDAGGGPIDRLKPAARLSRAAAAAGGPGAKRSALVVSALEAELHIDPALQLSDVLSGAREKAAERYKKEMAGEVYVPARAAADSEGRVSKDDGRRFDLDAALDSFAATGAAPGLGHGTADHRVLVLTGDSGCSKTTSLRQLHRRLLERWRPGAPFPVFVSLPAVAAAGSSLVDKLVDATGLQEDDRELRQELRQRVKLLVLLDGYDEARFSKAFHYLYPKLNSWADRVVVACRAQYLPSLGMNHKSYFMLDQAEDSSQLCEAWTCSFNQDQIGAYVQQWLGINPDPEHDLEWYKQQIYTILGLLDIIRTPFILSIACKELPLIDAKLKEKQKDGFARVLMRDVYDAFVTGLFKREEQKRAGQKCFTNFAANCRKFCRSLAILMDKQATTVLQVNMQLTFGVLNSKKLGAEGADADPAAKATALLTDERNVEFLRAAPIRSTLEDDGSISYSFVHASLKEYFVADSILPYLDARLAAQPVAGSQRCKSDTWTAGGADVVEGLGRRPLADDSAIVQFLADRARSEPPFVEALWACLLESANGGSPIAAANAMTVLNHAGASFAGKELRGIRAPGADLFRLEAAGADLRGADLSGALLEEANLAKADLRGAELSGCHLGVSPVCKLSGSALALRIAFSSDGRYIVSGCGEGTICIFDAETSREAWRFKASKLNVVSVALSADGKKLAWGGADRIVGLCTWGVMDESLLGTLKLEGHTDHIFSTTFSLDSTTLASGSQDKTVRLWNVADGALLRVLEGFTDSVCSVAFSPDGTILASCVQDQTLQLRSVADGVELRVLQVPGGATSAAFSPDGKALAAGCGRGDDTVRMWSIIDGSLLRVFKGHTASVCSISFSPGGNMLASGSSDRTARLWSVADGEPLRVFGGHKSDVLSVAFSPKGKALASCDMRTVRLWSTHLEGGNLRTRRVSDGHSNGVNSVAFLPDGRTMASCARNDKVHLWSMTDGTTVQVLGDPAYRVSTMALSPDGKTMATAAWGEERAIVRLWSTAEGTVTHVLKGHRWTVLSLAFSPDGKTLASSSTDTTLKLWSVADGTLRLDLKAHVHKVPSLSFSSDGQTLASGSLDGTARLWSVADGALLRVFEGHASGITSVALSPDGKTLASGSEDQTVRLWSVADGALLHVLKEATYSNVVSSLAFSPSGKTVASAHYDGVVRLWNVEDGALLRVLKGHSDLVFFVAFAPDGRTLASGSQDETVRLWRMPDGAPLDSVLSQATDPICIRRLGRAMLVDCREALADASTRAGDLLRRVFEQGGGEGWMLEA
eukprot:tig00000076_g2426.t1